MAAKIDWHRYETTLRHCHSIYSSNKDTVVIYTRLPRQKLYRRNAECARLDCHFVSPGSKLQLGHTLIHQSVFTLVDSQNGQRSNRVEPSLNVFLQLIGRVVPIAAYL